MELLATVLKHGFEPSAINPPAADEWPSPCSPNWISEASTPDPFFVDYFSLILGYEPGFAGVTELQELILTDRAHPKLDLGLPNQKELLSTVNFLGQSSLHLAVGNIRTVTKLLELGHGLDVTDRWGTTPLMYAAAMGYEDVAVLLLQRKADPVLRDNREERTFLDYAIVRGNWSFIHKVLSTIQDLYNDEAYQAFVHLVVLQAMGSRVLDITENIRRHHIPRVIRLCDNVNFTFSDSSRGVTKNNLMNYAETVEEREALVSRGFNLFSQPNSDGRLAIHEARDPSWISFCVEHGTAIDHVDAKGQTLLLILLSRLASFSLGKADTLRQIRRCLHLGADPQHSDDCMCPCSPGGCSSSAFFANGFDDSIFWSVRRCSDVFWVFEWQSILRDFHGEGIVKEFLLSFIRRIKFDELGMTHVCCHRGSGIPPECMSFIHETHPKIADEDIGDILEEEDEFIDLLDQTMRDLALKSVDDLQSYLLEILKDKYDQHLQKREAERTKILSQTGEKPEEHHNVSDRARASIGIAETNF